MGRFALVRGQESDRRTGTYHFHVVRIVEPPLAFGIVIGPVSSLFHIVVAFFVRPEGMI